MPLDLPEWIKNDIDDRGRLVNDDTKIWCKIRRNSWQYLITELFRQLELWTYEWLLPLNLENVKWCT